MCERQESNLAYTGGAVFGARRLEQFVERDSQMGIEGGGCRVVGKHLLFRKIALSAVVG